MVRFQVVSDVHLEFEEDNQDKGVSFPKIPARAPVLCLLGDIGYPGDPNFRPFIAAQADRFQHVIFVAGNHEYYGACYQSANRAMNQICGEFDNVHFLHDDSVMIDDVLFLGATLWTDTPPGEVEIISELVNDYHSIEVEVDDDNTICTAGTPAYKRRLTVGDTKRLHQQSVAWLTSEIRSAARHGQRVVVVTHHAPTKRNTLETYAREHPETVSMECTDLEYLMGDPVAVWAFGHTHWNSDQLISGTRVVSNQVGYIGHPSMNDAVFRAALVVDTEEEAFDQVGLYEDE